MSVNPLTKWLHQDAKGLPVLEDLSLEGRRRFLELHEAQLGMFWSRAFEMELYERPRWLDVSHVLADGRDETEAGEWIAEHLLERLRRVPELKWAHPWTSLEPWYKWLRGHQGTAPRVVQEERVDEGEEGVEPSREASWSDHSSELDQIDRIDLRDMVATLMALVQEWAGILVRISRSTCLPSLEVDWLWATCKERRELAQALQGHPVDARFLEQNKNALIQSASVQDPDNDARIARSRRGAAACFRFNLEVLAATSPALRRAHHVFLGPVADPNASPARPAAEVGAEEVEGFRETLRLSARRSSDNRDENPSERLWSAVFGAALVKGVARLLPSRPRAAVERDWAELTHQDETSEGPA